jgi:phospholipase/lecithinase/hemolysin
MFAAAAPIASMAGGMAGMGGNYTSMMGAQVVAQAASSAAQQTAQQEAMEALGGAAKSNIKKGDQITLEYKLMRAGIQEPVAVQSAVAKAKETGEDLVSPLIEQAATQVLTTISQQAAATP